jgi:hypothetical protein
MCKRASFATAQRPALVGRLLLEDGELLMSRRCVDEDEARYVARSFKQHTMRCGWQEAAPFRPNT